MAVGGIILLCPYWEAEPIGSYSMEHKHNKPTALLTTGFNVVGMTHYNQPFSFRCAKTGKVLAICRVNEDRGLIFSFPKPPSPDMVLIETNESREFNIHRKTPLLASFLWGKPKVMISFEEIADLVPMK